MSASTLSCLGVYPRSNLRRLWCACNRSGASNMPRLLPGEWQSHCSNLILVYTILAMNLIHNDVSIPSLQRPKSLVQKPRQNPSRCRVSISSCPNSRMYFWRSLSTLVPRSVYRCSLTVFRPIRSTMMSDYARTTMSDVFDCPLISLKLNCTNTLLSFWQRLQLRQRIFQYFIYNKYPSTHDNQKN